MNIRKYLLTLLMIFALLIIPYTKVQAESTTAMDVHFINVGQGDSILIKTPSNKIILIDAGPPEAGKQVVAYLKKQKIEKIDLFIATHPDIDHIGGFARVMQSIEVSEIVDSGKLHSTRTYMKYIEQTRKRDIPVTIVKENDQITIDPLVDIKVLNSYGWAKNNNASSIVLKVTYEDISFLLMGDVGRAQEKILLKEADIKANILKVAHHGSKTSSSLKFLEEVNPDVALLTYEKNNSYGHPVNKVIENLNEVNAHIYSTAVFGNVVIRTDGKGYFIFLEKQPMEGLLESIAIRNYKTVKLGS